MKAHVRDDIYKFVDDPTGPVKFIALGIVWILNSYKVYFFLTFQHKGGFCDVIKSRHNFSHFPRFFFTSLTPAKFNADPKKIFRG